MLEAKPPSQKVLEIAATEQVKKYRGKYGLVMVTNLRVFLLVIQGENAEAVPLESFQLAPDEQAFWSASLHPLKASRELGERFHEFISRLLLLQAPLYEPSALEGVLGMKFTGQKGEHFFRSTLVQTIFYGIFSAWVICCRSLPEHRRVSFDWKQAQWLINVPFIRTLFENLMMPGKLKPLGMVDILDRNQAVLNRVDRAVFFGKDQEEHAVHTSMSLFSRPSIRN